MDYVYRIALPMHSLLSAGFAKYSGADAVCAASARAFARNKPLEGCPVPIAGRLSSGGDVVAGSLQRDGGDIRG